MPAPIRKNVLGAIQSVFDPEVEASIVSNQYNHIYLKILAICKRRQVN